MVRNREPTGALGLLRQAVKYAETKGAAVDAILRRAGATPDALTDIDARLPLRLAFAIHEACAVETNDPWFGARFGKSLRLKDFDVLGYVMQNSATVGDAFQNLSRFMRLEMDATEVSARVERGRSVLGYRVKAPELINRRQDSMFSVGYALSMLAELTGSTVVADEVHLDVSLSGSPHDLEALYGCPVSLRQERNALFLPTSLLNQPVHNADAGLFPILSEHAQRMLDALPPEDDLVAEVRRRVSQSVRHGHPSISDTAQQMGLSERTLQRRLKDEKTSYNQIVDGVRRQLCEQYIREPRVSLAEIAFLLGYSEVSAFNRACQRWTGVAPGELRRRAA